MCVDKLTKIRIYHDARAKAGGICLNDLPLGGPNLTDSLAGILILFCKYKYVFCTDIASFFHQILLDERDINAFRYLWWVDQSMREECIKRFLSHIVELYYNIRYKILG